MTSVDGWKRARLGDVVIAKYGKALPEGHRRGGLIPVYGSNGVVGAHDNALTEGPTIILGRKGSSGEINYSPVPCWPIDTAYYIDDPGPFRLRFLDYLLRSLGLTQLDRSTAIPGLNRDQLYDIEVPVPPKAEQDNVVALLDSFTEQKVRAGSHLANGRGAIRRFRQAVIANACTGAMTAGWRKANPSDAVPLAPEPSTQAKANMSVSLNTDELLEIPDAWAWWSLEALTDAVIDYRGRTPPHEDAGSIPHVRTTQIRDGRIDWETDRFVTQDTYDKFMTRGLPRIGDVLFTMEAPLAEVGVVDRNEPFSIAQRILLLRPGSQIRGDFLALALRSHPVRLAVEHRSTGSGVLGIAYKRLRSVLIPVPPLAEQGEILTRVGQLFAVTDALGHRTEAASAHLELITRAVLAKAFRAATPIEPGDIGT